MFFAFNDSWIYTLLFIFYIFFIILFLLNILVAIVFDNYKKRVAEKQKKKLIKRLEYVEMYFDLHDEDNNGVLDLREAKHFFSTVLDLKFKKKAHRLTFLRIMKICDPEKNKVIFKDRVLEFFKIRGWKIIN